MRRSASDRAPSASDAPRPVWPTTTRPARTWSRTASTNVGPTVIGASPTRCSTLNWLTGSSIARSRGLAVQMVDSQVVLEQARYASLEAVQLGESVLADRDQEAHVEVRGGDGERKPVVEGAFAALLPVVEEVLLELIEDDEQLTFEQVREGLQPLAKWRHRRRRLRHGEIDEWLDRRSETGVERCECVAMPGAAEDCDRELRRAARSEILPCEREQVALDSRSEQRALSYPGRPVEQREPRRPKIRRDYPALRFAAEEVGRILDRVIGQSLVGRDPTLDLFCLRRWDSRAHPEACSACCLTGGSASIRRLSSPM